MKIHSAVTAFFMLTLILVSAGEAVADEGRTVTATGVAVLENITPEEAQTLALKRARSNAIEEVCGISIQAETFVKNFMVHGDFIHSVSYGHIISEEILSWDVDLTHSSKKLPPAIAYRVTLKTRVKPEKGQPDPYYQVTCKLNKKIFSSGDEMIIHVKASKPSYLTVLNFSADGRVFLLFPNQLRKDNYVLALEEFQVPSEADRKDVLKLQVSTLPGHKKDTEFIKVIATRKPLHLLEGLLFQGQYGVMDTVNFAVTEIARLVTAIPLRERAEHTVFYDIVSSN